MPATDDPFALLDLPRRFDIDRTALQGAYLKRSAALHPDRIADPIEQAEAAERAAKLNDARSVLADDERRANVLLALLGGPGIEDDKSLPDGLLMEMMEVRQDMEHALAYGDAEERRRLEEWAAGQRTAYIDQARALFETAGEAPDAAQFLAIRRHLNAWRYIERMIEQLDER